MRRHLAAAFLAASTLGLGEALFRLHGIPNLLPREAMLSLVWASLSYALPALGVAAAVAVVAWAMGRSELLEGSAGARIGVWIGVWIWLALFIEGLLEGYRWTLGVWRTLPLSAMGAFVLVWASARLWPRWLSRARSWLLLHGLVLLAGGLWIAFALSQGAAPLALALLAAALIVVTLARYRRAASPAWVGLAANGLLALGVVAAGLGADLYPQPKVAAGDRPDIVLVTVDTLRADSVGAYGYERAHTPTMDGLAAHGVLFEDVTAPDILTAPSHASILTGLDPLSHGVIANAGHPLRPGVQTVAHILRRNGYATAAFISGWTLRQTVIGADLGFDVYDQDLGPYSWLPENARRVDGVRLVAAFLDRLGPPLERSQRPAGETTDQVIHWLASRPPEPFFLWVHYFDPHIPLRPPPRYLRMFAPDGASWPDGHWYGYSPDEQVAIARNPAAVKTMIARYDGEVAYADAEVGRLLAAIGREKERGRRLLTVLTADHGESHGDRGLYFGRDLHRPSIRVPLILRLPDGTREGTRVPTPVRLIDVAPTILDVAGVAPPASMQGRTFLPLGRGEKDSAPRPTYSLAWEDTQHGGISRFALRVGPLELIENDPYLDHGILRGSDEEVYDLAHDPQQLRNLAGEHRPGVDALRRKLDAWRSKLSPGSAGHIDAEQQRMLRKLGYIR